MYMGYFDLLVVNVILGSFSAHYMACNSKTSQHRSSATVKFRSLQQFSYIYIYGVPLTF